MTFAFFIFRNYTRERESRSSKMEAFKGIMGSPRQASLSIVKEAIEGETLVVGNFSQLSSRRIQKGEKNLF